MAKEIERKFAVNDLSVIESRLGASIVQGYIADQPMTVRVRIIEAEAFMTLKSKSSTIERDEYEFPIPMHQARELLNRHCGLRVIEKKRYRIPHEGLIIEVDVFGGKLTGLVVAEIELDSVGQAISLPEWLGVELTYDSRFSNSALSMADRAPELPVLESRSPCSL
ncbi:MAG: CYTH domain-containing protein [Pseudomonadota bacterium]